MTEGLSVRDDPFESPTRKIRKSFLVKPEPKYESTKDPSFLMDDIEMKESTVYLNELKNLPLLYPRPGYTPTPANTPKNNFGMPSVHFLSGGYNSGISTHTPTPANTPSTSTQILENPFIPPAKDQQNDSFQSPESPTFEFFELKADLSIGFIDKIRKVSHVSSSNASISPNFTNSNRFEEFWGAQVSSPRAHQINESLSSLLSQRSSSITEIPLNCDEWSGSLVQDTILIYGIAKIISLHKRQSNPFLEPNSNSRKNAFKLVVKDPESRDEKIAYADCPRDVNINECTDFRTVLHRLVAEQIKKNTQGNMQHKKQVIEDVSDGEDSDDEEGFRCHYEERTLRGHPIGISVLIDPDDKGVKFRVVPLTEDGDEGYDKFVNKEDLMNAGFDFEGGDISNIDFTSAIDIFIYNHHQIQPQNVQSIHDNQFHSNEDLDTDESQPFVEHIHDQIVEESFDQVRLISSDYRLQNYAESIQSNATVSIKQSLPPFTILNPSSSTTQSISPFIMLSPSLPSMVQPMTQFTVSSPSSRPLIQSISPLISSTISPTSHSHSHLFTILALIVALLSILLALITISSR